MAEYLRTSYKPDMDFVDGELEERNVGEYEHARLQAALVALFFAQERVYGTRCVVEQRIRVADNRVRIADLAVLRAEAPREPVTLTPPLICIEVLSPEDRLGRAERVLEDYWRMGVPHVWLFDPIRRVAYVYDGELHMTREKALTVAGTEIQVDLDEVFSALD